jgi:hypothetical protein
MSAVIPTAAAGNAVVARSRSNDENLPVPAGHQESLQVGDRRQGHLMDDDLAGDVK